MDKLTKALQEYDDNLVINGFGLTTDPGTLSVNFSNSAHMNFISKNADKDWSWYTIFTREDLTEKFIRYNIEKFIVTHCYNIEHISDTLDIFKLVDEYPHKNWSWGGIVSQKNITFEFVCKYFDKIKPIIETRKYIFTKSQNIDNIKLIRQFPECDWDYYVYKLSCSDNNSYPYEERYGITIDMIINNIDLPWDWTCVTNRKDVNLEMVLNNQHLPWMEHIEDVINELYCADYVWLIEKYPDLPWDWRRVSVDCASDDAHFDFIEKYIDKNLDWDYVFRLCKLSIEFIDKCIKYIDEHNHNDNFNKDILFKNLSVNSDLTEDIVIQHGDMLHNKSKFVCNIKLAIKKRELIKHQKACNIIGKWFLEIKYNPIYKYCKNRLNNEYDALCLDCVN